MLNQRFRRESTKVCVYVGFLLVYFFFCESLSSKINKRSPGSYGDDDGDSRGRKTWRRRVPARARANGWNGSARVWRTHTQMNVRRQTADDHVWCVVTPRRIPPLPHPALPLWLNSLECEEGEGWLLVSVSKRSEGTMRKEGFFFLSRVLCEREREREMRWRPVRGRTPSPTHLYKTQGSSY